MYTFRWCGVDDHLFKLQLLVLIIIYLFTMKVVLGVQ